MYVRNALCTYVVMCVFTYINVYIMKMLFIPVGGINDHVYDIIQSCRDQEIPILFTLTKQQLGKILYKKVPVSVVGIFSYDGAEVS